ncbi:hypothetical protein HPB48_022816 [Haemaphysalis longicornis]|uniref:Ran gtpase-activating protein n=1 Tax=Haemaphysalis longicornis TaxID=44386 RepID=A0A9J6FW51_HAELO|nr:hypothetical protein HPB48_022816 [Haemaphysalis longicornis]
MASYYDTSDTDSSDTWNTDLSDQYLFTTDTWEGQLNFSRGCTGPEQRCWLCTELTPWNQEMHRLGFELVERRPGKLCLRSVKHRYGGDIDWDWPTNVGKASFLVSWLLQYHPCIDELKLGYSVYLGFRMKALPFPISLRPTAGSDCRRTLRGLELQQTASACFETIAGASRACFELVDLDAVGGLERLKLTYAYVNPKFAAELAKLLRRNASSIKRFEIKDVMVPRQVNHALRYLFSCEALTVSSFGYGRGSLRSVSSVARLLHSSTELKELSIGPIASRRQIDAIAKELENNTSLAKFGVQIGAQRCSPEPVFTALQRNTTLRELRVTGCRINGECGQSLALLVRKNTGLRLLFIGDAEVSELCLVQLAAALKVNTTLETLHLMSEMLPLNGIAELCKALCINKTLKELRFTDFECPQEFRATLARQLAQDECYNRLHLTWTEADLPGVTAALTSPLAVIEEFRLPYICRFSTTGLRPLFDALASSKCVRILAVCIKEDPGEKGRALCEMLKVNRSIKFLFLAIDHDGYKFVEDVSHALTVNASITKIVLSIGHIRNSRTATALSYILVRNKTAAKFFLHSPKTVYSEFVEEVSWALQQNKTIVKFGSARNCFDEEESFPFFEAVRRNRGALNRAVDFVVSPSLDRQCVEGFELFSGRPCLLKHLKKVTGKTEPEAKLAVAAAEYYRRDNYLLIAGIVRHSVTCHPAEATQVDALNKDCWQAIARHLKVTDVIP